MKIKQTLSRINYRNIFLFISWTIVIVFFLFSSINAVEVRQHEVCRGIQFEINKGQENYFIDEQDLKRELTHQQANLIGKRMVSIDFKKVERNIDKNLFVEKAMIYKSNTGNLVVEVLPKNPIVRVLANNGMNYYVSDKWRWMPTSGKYTKKVLLITGDVTDITSAKNPRDSSFNQQVKMITEFIVSDPFWSGLIDQIHVNNGKKICLITSIIQPYIVFGTVDKQMETKFKKIEIFLKKCLPVIQANNYESLDISFKNQVIGVKKQTINQI
jgi:cell division protein FtsQ